MPGSLSSGRLSSTLFAVRFGSGILVLALGVGGWCCDFRRALETCHSDGRCSDGDSGARANGGGDGSGGGNGNGGGEGDGGLVSLAFASAQNFQLAAESMSIAAGDLDGDGRADIVSANGGGSDTLSVLLSLASGGFMRTADLPTGIKPKAIDLGFVDGDQKLDLVAAGGLNRQGQLTVLPGSGAGGFGPATTSGLTTLNPIELRLAALDADGLLDGLVSGYDSDAVLVLAGAPEGGLIATATATYLLPGPTGLAIADFNGDGRLDFAAGNENPNSSVTVFLGNGDRTFSPTGQNLLPGQQDDHWLAAGDFDGNDTVDLVVADYSSQRLLFLSGVGDGTFASSSSAIPIPGRLEDMKAADFNRDGALDLVVLTGGSTSPFAGKLIVLEGKGDATFRSVATLDTLGNDPGWLAIADFDGDGRLDVAATNDVGPSVAVFMNRSTP
jgi:hypothetical protein